MPSFKRPSSPFGRKSPVPVEEPSGRARGQRGGPWSSAPSRSRAGARGAEAHGAEPAEVIPETDETHLAAAKLQASVRGRNARKKTKRRKEAPDVRRHPPGDRGAR